MPNAKASRDWLATAKQQRSPANPRQHHLKGFTSASSMRRGRRLHTVELVRQSTTVWQLGTFHPLTGQHCVQQHLRRT